MQNKALIVLSGLTVVVVTLALLAVQQRGSAVAAPDEDPGPLLGDLKERINDVAALEIQSRADTLTLRRENEDWVLVERGSYPVEFTKVKEAVVGVANLEIEEPKTSRPENHAKLGVQAPEEEDATSKRIVLRDAGGTELARVILGEGKFRQGSQAIYARRDGEDQVYLCAGNVRIDTNPTSWIERDLLRLESDRVQDVRIVHQDGEEILIGRDPENHTQFVVENLPADREPKFPGVANSLGTALTYLGLEDVRPASEVDFEAGARARAHFSCPDGLAIEVETAAFEDKTWARIVASYVEPAAGIGPPAPAPEEEAEPG